MKHYNFRILKYIGCYRIFTNFLQISNLKKKHITLEKVSRIFLIINVQYVIMNIQKNSWYWNYYWILLLHHLIHVWYKYDLTIDVSTIFFRCKDFQWSLEIDSLNNKAKLVISTIINSSYLLNINSLSNIPVFAV